MTHGKTHPGEILKEEFLWPFGISARALAEELEVPVALIADIVEERPPVTKDTALRLSEHFGSPAVFWLGLQADRWDAQLYVRNVFDDDKMPSAGQTGPDLPNTEFRLAMRTDFPPTVLASPKIPSATFANLPNPRQAGIQFRYRFGRL